MARKLFKTQYFSLVIAAIVFGLFVALAALTAIPDRLELKVLNVHFGLRTLTTRRTIQEGVLFQERNPAVSPSIEIIAVDTSSLNQFGRWPWPRWRHADLVNSFARITDQTARERALFLDFFFIEPQDQAFSDAVLIDAIRDSERVYLETVLANEFPPPDATDEFFERHDVLFDRAGRLPTIGGEWWNMRTHFGLEPPLQPYGAVVGGFGHANFNEDWDTVFRRQPLVAKISRLVQEIRLDELTTAMDVDPELYERLAWVDTDGRYHHIEHPLSDGSIDALRQTVRGRAPLRRIESEGDGVDEFYVIRKFQDQFVPSITLSLALSYFGRTFDDLRIELGRHIVIPDVRVYDAETDNWVPYAVPVTFEQVNDDGEVVRPAVSRRIDDIVIPINEHGEMLINFMGPRSSPARDGYQTFPVRSYAAYTARGVAGPDPFFWPRTRAATNKILMVGPFSPGMADDEKLTPVGLMYGVEMHANALNTIIMDRFLRYAPAWANLLILLAAVLIVAALTGILRNPLISFAIAIVLVASWFLFTTIVFDNRSLILNFSSPALAMLVTFVSVVLYRILTEGREKRMITETFGKYVSPDVVGSLLDSPPVLGGVEQEITVMFSDIRGFTTISEGLTSQQLVKYLNGYLTAMTDVILEYNGTLDKYVGDEIMCFWGAPLPQRDHRILACKCALRQMEVLHEFNERMARLRVETEEWAFLPPAPIEIGIGINSGPMTVGNMGSSGRLNYTLMGDHVNLGARLEGQNKMYGTHVIISEYTHDAISDKIVARDLDNIKVKGKNKPVLIYELIDADGGLAPTPDELAYDTLRR